MYKENTGGPTGTILDAHEKKHGWHIWGRRETPTALALAAAALEDCRRDQLHHKQLAEYHGAMDAMLRAREARLQKDVARLSKKGTSPAGGTDGE